MQIENQFISAIAAQIKEYVDGERCITVNEEHKTILIHALSIAHSIFPDAELTIESDPFMLGSIILSIMDFDLDITKNAISSFSEIIKSADNFTIYPTQDHMLKLDIMYHDILNITEKRENTAI